MDHEKYDELFKQLGQSLGRSISETLTQYRELFFMELEKDIEKAQKSTKRSSRGWRHFLKMFYLRFNEGAFEGFLYELRDGLKYKSNEAIKDNSLMMGNTGHMFVHLEKRPFKHNGMDLSAWYGRLQLTEKGVAVAKEVV